MAKPKPGSYVHMEFASVDPSRTRKFLEDVFGWEFQSMPGMEYHVYAAPDGPGGAVMPPNPERPGGLLSYILSEDLDADLRKIEAAGGRVRIPKKDIPGVGWWALFEEPTGIVLALFQTAAPDRGPVARYRAGPAPPTARKRSTTRHRVGPRKKARRGRK